MKVKLTNLRFDDKNRDGVAYLDKNQRPYTRVGIQTEQHASQWLGGLAYQNSPSEVMLKWRVRDEVEIETKQNGQYLNFSLPGSGGGAMMAKLEALEEICKKILAHVSNLEVADSPNKAASMEEKPPPELFEDPPYQP